MRTNPLKQLETLGQSIWLDYIRRDLMTSGELRRLNVPSARLENEGVEKFNKPFDKLMETLTQISKQNIKRES